MTLCQEAKQIVNAILDETTQSIHSINVRMINGWLTSTQYGTAQLVREIAAYLMALENRDDATRVAVLVEQACPKTRMEFSLVEMVQQKTRLHSGAFMHLPPNPDVTYDGFVLTPHQDETPVLVEDLNKPVLMQADEDEWELL
jgi:hypothetical protein